MVFFQQVKSIFHILFYKNTSRQMLYVANTEYEAKQIYEELCVYMKNKVEFLDTNEFLFYSLDARDRKLDARRLKTYFKLFKT